jgi:hypothetical protein
MSKKKSSCKNLDLFSIVKILMKISLEVIVSKRG